MTQRKTASYTGLASEIEHEGIPSLLYSPRSPLKNGTHYSERTYPNGILKRKNLKPLTPEFPPRTFKSNQLKFDWLTPQPSNKINKFDLSPVKKPLKPLLRKEHKHPVPPLHMDILMQSRTEPDGQLDEASTNSPNATNSTKTDAKNRLNAPMHIKISSSVNSPARNHSSNSPTTPLVLPYAVSVVNDQEAEDFNAFNKLEKTFNEKHHEIVIRKHSLTTPTHHSETFSPINKRNFSNLRVSPIHDTSPMHAPLIQKQAKRRDLSISTDSGTEMEAATVSPLIHSYEGPSYNVDSLQPEANSFKKFFGPISRRRRRSDGVKSSFSIPDSPTSIRSIKGTVTACLPIRLPKWSHKRKPKTGKGTKSSRRKELCIDDIHVLPPDSTMSQLIQQGKLPNEIMASPTHILNDLLSGSPSKINTPLKSPQTSFPTSPVKSDSFSPAHSKSSHQYLPLNLVPMSAKNSKDLHTRFPFGFEHPIESLPLTKSKFPNDQSDLSDERESIFSNRPPLLKSETSPGPELSIPKKKKPPTKPIRSMWTDSTHLLKYKSKSEMNLGMADVGASTPFCVEMQKYQQQRKRTNSVIPSSVKPEIPAFPPNVSQDEVKRSLQNVSANSTYMPPNNTYTTPSQPTKRYNRHIRTNSMYENIENMPSQQATGEYHELPNRLTFDTVSTGDLLQVESPPKIPQIGTASSITTVDSTGSSYVQMRFDQSISDDIGQAVTSYKKIVSENSKLIKVMSDQLYHQYMQTFNWETIDWDQVRIVDDQQPPLNISILVSQGELQKEFSLWPKQFNEDDVAERAFQSAQVITRSIPRNPYIQYVHSLINIPFELKEKCYSLNAASTACIVDQSRTGTLANYLTDHKPLLDIDPERYERNVILLLIQILSGVAHMHRHKVVHRDLNLSDILLSKEKDDDELLQVKISGFTYALHRSGPPRAQPFLYSFEELQWLGGDETKLPPEINNAQNNLPELNYSGTDSFAVGCMIYEMMHEPSPFEDQNLITKAYTSQDLPNLPQKSKYSIWLQNVAKGLLEMNLQRRLDANFACTILQLVILDAERFIVDADINEKNVKALIYELQGKFLHRMIEKSSTTLLTGRPLELNVLEKIELNFLANSQPYNIVRAIKHFQNHS